MGQYLRILVVQDVFETHKIYNKVIIDLNILLN